MGLQLLHRTTCSLYLTEVGESLLVWVRPALQEMDAVLNDAKQNRARPAGAVRVHSFRFPATRFISPVLACFHADYPDIKLDITLSYEVVDIVDGRFDVALRIGEVIEMDLITVRQSADVSQIAVASPCYLVAHGTLKHPRDLAGHKCIGWRWPGHERVYGWEFCENGKWFVVRVVAVRIYDTQP